MAIAFTAENKRTIKRLLQLGRWGNQSEILRYGLHLVQREVTAESREEISPYPADELRAAARRQTPAERAEERKLARASRRHRPEDA